MFPPLPRASRARIERLTRGIAVDNPPPVPHFSPMADSPLFAKLAAALRERIAVIADRELFARDPAAHLEKLRTASEQIASLQKQLPSPVDPHLAHYLDRCSYDKALAFLEGAP